MSIENILSKKNVENENTHVPIGLNEPQKINFSRFHLNRHQLAKRIISTVFNASRRSAITISRDAHWSNTPATCTPNQK
jgi:hypothetical protein